MTQNKTRIFLNKIPYFKQSFQISKYTDEQKYILTVFKVQHSQVNQQEFEQIAVQYSNTQDFCYIKK